MSRFELRGRSVSTASLCVILVLATLMTAMNALMARAAELVMFEEAGCVWCQRWHAEIGPGYPRSAEGQLAPLHRIDIRAPRPPDWRLTAPVTMTPTFVVMDDGREIGRLLGYPGADFFYPRLEYLLRPLQFGQQTPTP